ncbi:MAG: hypothetical protein IJX72_04170 [Clostridia bacterium]|nr:hypothetical protein [Clostridia bacterium]
MKKNTAEKYFHQKSWSLQEIICIIAIIISAVVATIVPGGIPMGIPIMVVAVIVLVFSKSAKIKDAEIDAELEKLVAAHMDLTGCERVVKCYDLYNQPIVKGKDGGLRSPRYVISVFTFGHEDMEITVYNFDLVSHRVDKRFHKIPKDEEVSLIEEAGSVPGGRKTLQYLEGSSISERIPVCTEDVHSAGIIERVCNPDRR